jgi:transposase
MHTEQESKPRLDLPKDIEGCHSLIQELMDLVERLGTDVTLLKQRLHTALRDKYGRSSEKLSPGQLMLFAQELEELLQSAAKSNDEPKDSSESPQPRKASKKKGGGGRASIDASIPRVPKDYYPSADEMRCACCNGQKIEIGKETQEQLDYIPGSFRVIQHITHKFACKACQEGVVEGEKPEQIHNGGKPAEGLIAQISTALYADHQPLHRQEQTYLREGVYVPRSSMGRWLDMSGEAAKPIYDRMHELLLECEVLQADESPVPLLDKNHLPRKAKKGYAWSYYGDQLHPYVLYDLQPDRTAERAKQFLEDYSGLLLTDGYGGYEWYPRERSANCNVHARRKFEQAQSYDKRRAGLILALYNDLYKIEGRVRGLSSEEILFIRQSESVPILDQMKEFLFEWQLKTPPKTPLGVAINYALPRWDKLCRFTHYACLRPDTNLVENSIRPIAVGRKNWLHIGAESVLEARSVHASLVNTCKRLGINPFLYLRDVFIRLGRGVDCIDELLPDRWQLQNPPEKL